MCSYIMDPRYCPRFQQNIGYSQPLLPTLALSNSWQPLSDASLATPAKPTAGGRQLCKSQIKHNLYSSQHFSTVIWAMYCPWDIHKWFHGGGSFRKRTRSNTSKGRRFVWDILDHRPVSGLDGIWALRRDAVHRHSGHFVPVHKEMENLLELLFCRLILVHFVQPATNDMKIPRSTVCMHLCFHLPANTHTNST